MILDITRAHIRAQFGERIVTIQGEGYLPGGDSPDFVIYESSVQHWDPPHDREAIDDATKQCILDSVKSELESQEGMSVEIE